MNRLEEVVLRVCGALDASGIAYLVVGGLAGNALGEPRMTHDLDVLVFCTSEEEFHRWMEHLPAGILKFDPAQAIKDFIENRSFTAESDGVHVDFLIGGTVFEAEMYQRRRRVAFAGATFSIPSPEDFIVMKCLAGRDKDLLDAHNVVLRHGTALDRGYIQKWIDNFAGKTSPVLRERFERLFHA